MGPLRRDPSAPRNRNAEDYSIVSLYTQIAAFVVSYSSSSSTSGAPFAISAPGLQSSFRTTPS